ncbi:glycosyltransferase family 2 protein [Candidatus Woesearchaeota archaeon]|nr:glycosyltransferase family 2 protein [Candidatus Woesearchaeota archaeon]
MEKNKPKIIAVLIAYNAEKTLEEFYKDFPKNLVDEIILVDDASKDNTFELAKKLGINAYRNPVNLGYGGNMKRALGIALARGGDILIDIHPDGEYKPSAIPLAIKKVQEGSEFVLGKRFDSFKELLAKGMYWWKIPPLFLMTSINQVVLGTKIKDLHQGFRVYTKKLLENVSFEENSDKYLFSFELIAQALHHGIKIDQVPVETEYSGKKRGASFKSSIIYFSGTFKVLSYFLLRKVGLGNKLFKKPTEDVLKRAEKLANLV